MSTLITRLRPASTRAARAEVTRPCCITVLLWDLNTQKILPDNQSNSYIGFM